MKNILTAFELADKIIKDVHPPTSDGINILPVNIEAVKAMIARAVMEDRVTEELDFGAIADKVMATGDHGEFPKMERNLIITALKYAQASGARFKNAGPSETDYAEAVQNAVEAFCTSLKDKGLWN